MNITNLEQIGKENGVSLRIFCKAPNILSLRIIKDQKQHDYRMKAIEINEDNILRKIAEFRSGR